MIVISIPIVTPLHVRSLALALALILLLETRASATALVRELAIAFSKALPLLRHADVPLADGVRGPSRKFRSDS